MALGIAEALRNAQLNVLRDALDVGATPGKMLLYGGTRPDTGAAIGEAPHLATCVLSKPSAANAAGGELTFAAITDELNAPAAGDATWARFVDGDDAFVCDADVGVFASEAEVRLNSVTVSLGGIVRINSGKFTSGNA